MSGQLGINVNSWLMLLCTLKVGTFFLFFFLPLIYIVVSIGLILLQYVNSCISYVLAVSMTSFFPSWSFLNILLVSCRVLTRIQTQTPMTKRAISQPCESCWSGPMHGPTEARRMKIRLLQSPAKRPVRRSPSWTPWMKSSPVWLTTRRTRRTRRIMTRWCSNILSESKSLLSQCDLVFNCRWDSYFFIILTVFFWTITSVIS